MKKTVSLIFIFLISFPAQAKLSIFACEPEWAELARLIGKENAAVFSATKAGEDPHHIQAKPGLIAKLKSADLLLCSGAGLEQNWLSKLLKKAGNRKVSTGQPGHLMAADVIPLLEADGSHKGDIHELGNPHLHMNPHNIAKVAVVLGKRLQQLDGATDYSASAAQFVEQWNKAISGWERQATVLKDVAVVVNHENWAYLNNWVGLKQAAALESRPGIAPSSAYLSQVLQKVKKSPVKMIITASHQDTRAAVWLSEQTNIPLAILPYTVGANNASDLYALFDSTIRMLVRKSQ